MKTLSRLAGIGAAGALAASMSNLAPNPQMQAVLDALAALDPKPIPTLTAPEARKQPTPADAVKRVLAEQGKPTEPDSSVKWVDRMIPGPEGELQARIFTPANASGPLPVVVYYHGGGWVIANRIVYAAGARALSKGANAVVVSVDYRRGPEDKFPAAHDDALGAYRWVLENASEIGGDPERVSLAGESAGGNLAVATAIAARDENLQAPLAVIAVYPIAGSDTTTESYVEHAEAKPLSRAMMSWFFDKYLRSPEDRMDPRINLVEAELQDLPPVTIINAEIDPLRSEGEALAALLREAGNEATQRTFDGVTHEFFGMAAVVDAAAEANRMASEALMSRQKAAKTDRP